jgi:hypothetical protein
MNTLRRFSGSFSSPAALALAFFFWILFAGSLSAQAQCTDSWTGAAGDGNWGTAANWSTGQVPGNNDNVCIQIGGAAVSEAGAGAATLTLGSSDSLTIDSITNTNTNLNITGSSIANSGQIIFAPVVSFGGAGISLSSTGTVTLSGPGTITMNADSFGSNSIGGSGILLNQSTIQGAGSLDMTVNNATTGVINGNLPGFQLILGRNQSTASTNTGILEATNGGQLAMGSLTLNNVGGTIQALGAGSAVSLVNEGQGGQTITGGTYTTSSGGIVYAGNSTTMDGTNGNTITNKGTLAVSEPQGGSNFQGTINNSGSMEILPTANGVVLTIPSGQTLTLMGSGTLTMGDGTSNAYNNKAGWGGGTLVNQQTIQGTGTILNLTGITNSGTINANIATGTNNLMLQLGRAGASTNTGTIEASNGGVLQIGSVTINNVGGTISASGTGSNVQLVGSLGTSGLTITGGTYDGSGGGIIYGFGGSVLDGTTSTVNNTGDMIINSGDLQIQGTLNNTGTVQILGPTDDNGNTYLQIPNGENLTVTGNGTIVMGDGTDNDYNNKPIIGNNFGTSGSFTNSSNITGSGTIGDLVTGVTNNGVINANVPIGTNNIQLVMGRIQGSLFTNKGTLEASNGGEFSFGSSGLQGTFTNNGTLLVAANSKLDVTNSNGFTNLANNALTGGSYNVTGTLLIPGNINTNAASITLNGLASQILNPNTTALAGFITNSTAGSFTIAQGQNYTSPVAFTNMGTVVIGKGSTFTVGSGGNYMQTGGKTVVTGKLTSSATEDGFSDAPSTAGSIMITKGSLLGNGGNVAAAVTSSGIVLPGASAKAAGKLTITGNYTQVTPGGTLDANIAGTNANQIGLLKVTGTATLAGTLNIKLLNNFVPVIGATFQILTAQSVNGTFGKVNGTSINSSEHFTVTYNSNNVTLTVVSGP